MCIHTANHSHASGVILCPALHNSYVEAVPNTQGVYTVATVPPLILLLGLREKLGQTSRGRLSKCQQHVSVRRNKQLQGSLLACAHVPNNAPRCSSDLGRLFLLWWHEAPPPMPLLTALIPHSPGDWCSDPTRGCCLRVLSAAPWVLSALIMDGAHFGKLTCQQHMPLQHSSPKASASHSATVTEFCTAAWGKFCPVLIEGGQNPLSFLIHSNLAVTKEFPKSHLTNAHFPSYLCNEVSIFILPPLHFLLPCTNNALNWALTDFFRGQFVYIQ